MKVTPTAIPDVLMIEPEVFADARGLFFESFNQRAFDQAIGQHINFLQDNHSHSAKNVLRGLHYQVAPSEEVKLVRCTRGAIHDVIVDPRPRSPSFKRWFAVELTASNRRMLYVPEGVAHGFVTLADDTEVFYQMSQRYDPACYRGVRWDDPEIGIVWPMPIVQISEHDRQHTDFSL